MTNLVVPVVTGFCLAGVIMSLVIQVEAPAIAKAEDFKSDLVSYIPDVSQEPINEIIAEEKDYWGIVDEPKVIEKVVIQATEQVTPQPQGVREMSFRMNNGTYLTGAQIIDEAMGNANARKLWDQFNLHFGGEIANTAIISLKFENGSYWERTTGVCNQIHWINGDYRDCAYPDMNSAGFDVGIKQINTFYQSGGLNEPSRIAKLGGPNCRFESKEASKVRSHPCNQEIMNWLYVPQNNIHIAVDLFADQGFCPWYGWRRAFNKPNC